MFNDDDIYIVYICIYIVREGPIGTYNESPLIYVIDMDLETMDCKPNNLSSHQLFYLYIHHHHH